MDRVTIPTPIVQQNQRQSLTGHNILMRGFCKRTWWGFNTSEVSFMIFLIRSDFPTEFLEWMNQFVPFVE